LNSERVAVRGRSIVGLYREETIGTLPIEEVRADLDRLGVDSAEVIDLAKRLAKGGDTDPAADLLARLEQADAADCEIADLERQSMQRVLDVLPPDLVESAKATTDDLASKTKYALPEWKNDDEVDDDKAEAAAADARVKAKIETIDAAFRPAKRRGRVIVGSVVALAACIVLLFAVKPGVLDWLEWSTNLASPFENQSTSTGGGDDDAVASAVETALVESDGGAPLQQPVAPKRAVQGLPIETVPPTADDRFSSSFANVQPQDAGRAHQSVVPALTADGATAGVQAEIASTTAGLPAPAVPVVGEAGASVNGATSLPDSLTGVFILDAARAPDELVALESVGRDNRLGAKRGEASLRALGRKVLALIAFERDGARIEAAVIEANSDVTAGQSVTGSRPSALQTPNLSGFELLELSRSR
jgi:hypothetical protein